MTGSRVAIVTGGSLGIGRATAVAFAREGCSVAVVGRDASRSEEVAREATAAGAAAMAVRADVSREGDVRVMVERVLERWGRLDVLVNNAGVYVQEDALQTSLTTWERILATNLTGAFLCIKYAVPAMDDGGVVVNVSSEAGLVGIRGQVAYNVSKSGLIGLTRSCAVDFAARGVRVNCVCPGTTDTPLVQEAVERSGEPAAARRRLEEARPARRLGSPEEIASAILFLASPSAGYMTGAVLSVDGGYTAQ